VAAFAEFKRATGANATLLLHVAPTGEDAYDIDNLVSHFKLQGSVVKLLPSQGKGLADDGMPWVYACMDAYLSMAQGEGWNLCAMEAMACGIPCVLPDQGGPGEWAKPAASMVECPTYSFTPWKINAKHGVPSVEAAARALVHLYRDDDFHQGQIERGLELTARPEYRWPSIGRAFAQAVKQWVGVPVTEQVCDGATVEA